MHCVGIQIKALYNEKATIPSRTALQELIIQGVQMGHGSAGRLRPHGDPEVGDDERHPDRSCEGVGIFDYCLHCDVPGNVYILVPILYLDLP